MSIVAKVTPSKRWYWLGLVILLGGLIGSAAIAVAGVRASATTFDRYARLNFPADAACRLTFTKAGTYEIFVETGGSTPIRDGDCRPTSVSQPVEPRAAAPGGIVFTGEDGTRVEATQDRGGSLSTSAHAGARVARVTLAAPGNYSIDVAGASGATAMSFGRNASQIRSRSLRSALATALASLAVGIGVLAVTSRRRRASRRRIAADDLAQASTATATATAWQPSDTAWSANQGWPTAPVPMPTAPQADDPWAADPVVPVGMTPSAAPPTAAPPVIVSPAAPPANVPPASAWPPPPPASDR